MHFPAHSDAKLPISWRRVLACRDTLATAFSERRSGSIRMSGSGVILDGGPLPDGIKVMRWIGREARVERLDAVPIVQLHEEVLRAAWRDGAWDLRVLRCPPLSEQQLVGTCNGHWTDMTLRDAVLDAARAGSLIEWSWAPMRNGPPIRRRAHAHKDRTLKLDCSRSGEPPASLKTLDWSRLGGCDVAIRLGVWSDECRPAPPRPPRSRSPRPPFAGPDARATARQRAYIVHLRHRQGRHGEPLPASLTRGKASLLIDALLGEAKT